MIYDRDHQLAIHARRVAEAEEALETVRSRMRMTAKMLGAQTAHLFGKSRFVTRESANKWIDEARADAVNDSDALDQAYRRGYRDGQAAAEAIGGVIDPQQARTQALAAAIIRAGKKRRGEIDDNPDDQSTTDQLEEGAPNGDDDDDEQPFRKRKKKSKHPTDSIPHDLSDKLRETEPEPEQSHANVVDLAAKIIAAGRKARGLPPLKR
jgi:hypothetical protein